MKNGIIKRDNTTLVFNYKEVDYFIDLLEAVGFEETAVKFDKYLNNRNVFKISKLFVEEDEDYFVTDDIYNLEYGLEHFLYELDCEEYINLNELVNEWEANLITEIVNFYEE